MQQLALNEYQNLARLTDQTIGKAKGRSTALLALGLFGEAGSLLSEVKKKQRDSLSYVGYQGTVTEEFGDVLWYLAVLAAQAGISLESAARIFAPTATTFHDLQPQRPLPLDAPTVTFEKTLLELAAAVGRLAGTFAAGVESPNSGQMAAVLAALVAAANEAGVQLEEAARNNLAKTADRWPAEKVYPQLFDNTYPPEEQLPRSLVLEVFERTGSNKKRYVMQRCNGLFMGDRLTDNVETPDDYRFHDVYHYAFAAILGWSPVTRALFRLKRKSQPTVDENQDGARAVIVEEGIATYVFSRAKALNFFKGHEPGDLGLDFLKSVRGFARDFESGSLPLWLWEEAILKANEALRFLIEHRACRIEVDLTRRSFVTTRLA